jgi:hypothetical protein
MDDKTYSETLSLDNMSKLETIIASLSDKLDAFYKELKESYSDRADVRNCDGPKPVTFLHGC